MLGRERLADRPRDIQRSSLDLRHVLRATGEVPCPPGGRVFVPATLSLGVGVVPPRPGPTSRIARVADWKDPEAAVEIERHRTEIITRRTCLPIGGRLVLDPGINQWKDIVPIVIGMSQEDRVIDAWDFEGQFLP